MTIQEARSHGVSIATATLDTQALQDLATYGFKGVTGYPEGSELDTECRNAAQDQAKAMVD